MSLEINAPATLTTSGGNIDFNPASPATDYYFIDELAGLGQAPLRTARDPMPQAHGTIIHPSWRNERLITVTGRIVSVSLSTRTTMGYALQAALESIESADGTWTWTDSAGAHSVTVRSDIAVEYTGGQGLAPKNFLFGLVAADPAIT